MARISDADYPALAMGLMSGTSVDGIDGALLALTSSAEFRLEASLNMPYPAALRAAIDAVIAAPKQVDLDRLGGLHIELGRLYAQAARALWEVYCRQNEARRGDSAADSRQNAGGGGDSANERQQNGRRQNAPAARTLSQTVAVLGCHGQTIRHQPGGEFPFTWQLGDGATVAQLTGVPTVTDFRAADMALGGQGAPLAPAFHRALFSAAGAGLGGAKLGCAIVNLGGIANITHLPASGGAVTGFDTGPANTLLDGWCQRRFNAPFDRAGAIAAGGVVQQKLLESLTADAYFALPPPKSTGREYFNQPWLDHAIAAHPPADAADLLATLTALTAATVAAQINRLQPPVEAVYACGGGSRNRTLMAMLGDRCHAALATTADLGLPPQWVEAAAFAWMAHRTLHRAPTTLPSVTGAAAPTIAGAIYWPG